VLHGLYSKFFAELAAPHNESLLLVAEAGERMLFQPGSSPALPSPPLRWVGNMSPEEAQVALKLAETTAPVPRWVNASRSVKVQEGQAAREAAALRSLVSDPQGVTASWAEEEPLKAEWLLGSFLTQKLAESQSGAQGRASAREAAVQAIIKGSTEPSSPKGRSPSAGRHPTGGFEGFGAGAELRLGIQSPSRRGRSGSPKRESSEGRKERTDEMSTFRGERARSSSTGQLVKSQWPGKVPGSEDGITDLWSKQPQHLNCSSCGHKVPIPKRLLAGQESEVMFRKAPRHEGDASDKETRKTARVVSSAYRHGNRADFYLGGKKIPLDGGKFQMHEHSRRGFNVVTVDPDSQQVVSVVSYDTSSSSVAASAQLTADLNALPEGRLVLIGIRGSGLEGLNAGALKALRRVGATAMPSGGKAQEGYALIGIKGGEAAAERRGHCVEIEAKLPRPPWQEPQDLSWYFQQQKQFLSDLKVAEDRHDAWSSKVVKQEDELETMKKKMKALEAERDGLRKDLKEAVRERDEWQVAALRVMSKREFRSSVESLEAAKRRSLPP